MTSRVSRQRKNPITPQCRLFLREWLASVDAVKKVWPDVRHRDTHRGTFKYAVILMAAARLGWEPERVASALASIDDFKTAARRWPYLDDGVRHAVSSAVAEVYRARQERNGS